MLEVTMHDGRTARALEQLPQLVDRPGMTQDLKVWQQRYSESRWMAMWSNCFTGRGADGLTRRGHDATSRASNRRTCSSMALPGVGSDRIDHCDAKASPPCANRARENSMADAKVGPIVEL